jgi:hypothetical protein
MYKKPEVTTGIVQEVHEVDEKFAVIVYDQKNFRIRTIYIKKDDARKIGIKQETMGNEIEMMIDPKSHKISRVAQVIRTWVPIADINAETDTDTETYNYRHEYA